MAVSCVSSGWYISSCLPGISGVSILASKLLAGSCVCRLFCVVHYARNVHRYPVAVNWVLIISNTILTYLSGMCLSTAEYNSRYTGVLINLPLSLGVCMCWI